MQKYFSISVLWILLIHLRVTITNHMRLAMAGWVWMAHWNRHSAVDIYHCILQYTLSYMRKRESIESSQSDTIRKENEMKRIDKKSDADTWIAGWMRELENEWQWNKVNMGNERFFVYNKSHEMGKIKLRIVEHTRWKRYVDVDAKRCSMLQIKEAITAVTVNSNGALAHKRDVCIHFHFTIGNYFPKICSRVHF